MEKITGKILLLTFTLIAFAVVLMYACLDSVIVINHVFSKVAFSSSVLAIVIFIGLLVKSIKTFKA